MSQIEKLAEVALREIEEGTPITESLAELKKKIRPGDILASKTIRPNFGNELISFRQAIAHGRGPSRWTHVAIAPDKKSVIHSYARIAGGKIDASDFRVFKHSLDEFDALGRDVLLLRPRRAAENTKKKAVDRAKKLLGTRYRSSDLVRAAVWSAKKEKNLKVPKEGIVCTAIPGLAYPTLNIHPTKSNRHLLPADIVVSKALKPIIAYSGEFKGKSKTAEVLDEMRKVSELKLRRTPKMSEDQFQALRERMGQTAERLDVKKPIDAAYVPKGGIMPKILRPMEMMGYKGSLRPEEQAKLEKMIDKQEHILASLRNPEVAAHELGHGKVHNTPYLGKFISVARPLGGISGTIAGAAGPMIAESRLGRWGSVAAPLVGDLPTLLDEGLASRHAIRAMQESGDYNPAQIDNMKKNLRDAFLTYVKSTAVEVGTSAAMAGLAEAMRM